MAALRVNGRGLVAAVLFVSLIGANIAMEPVYNQFFSKTAAGRTASDILLDVLGEIRTFVAQVIWFKADVFHHVKEGQGVEPLGDPDMLAFDRIVATLDPHFVDAYDVGSFALIFKLRRYDQGMRFLEEGLHYNPDARALHWDKELYLHKMHRYAEAIPEGNRSVALSEREIQSTQNDPTLSSVEKQARIFQQQIDILNALRVLSYCYRALHQRDPEILVVKYWLTLRPDDPTALRRLDELHVLTETPFDKGVALLREHRDKEAAQQLYQDLKMTREEIASVDLNRKLSPEEKEQERQPLADREKKVHDMVLDIVVRLKSKPDEIKLWHDWVEFHPGDAAAKQHLKELVESQEHP